MTGKTSPGPAARLHDLLSGHRAPGVYGLVTTAGGDEVVEAAQAAGWTTWVLGGAPTTKHDLLDAMAAAVKLPDWFGHNWDALADGLSDVATDGPGGLLIWDGAELLAEGAPGDWSTALAVLRGAVAYHRRHGWSFAVVCTGRRPLPALPAL